MPAADNDWRLTNQEAYLSGATLTRRQYRRWSETWEHDHCEFCFAKFMEAAPPGELSEGYCTLDEYRWICPRCFEDFKDRFGWKIVASPSFRVLPGLPPFGPRAIQVPKTFSRFGREGSVVEFLPDTPSAWIGNFESGHRGYSGAHVHPNGRDILVFANGAGWVVDPETRECRDLADGAFILAVWRVRDPAGLVCDVQGYAFIRIGPNGVVWRTKSLSCGGFKNVIVTRDAISGLGNQSYESEMWTPFHIDMTTGHSQEGPA